MTVDDIMEDKAKLNERAERLKADLNATIGAIQQCDAWIERLKHQEKPAAEDTE